MAYLEVKKDGEVVQRRGVDDEMARRGCVVRLGEAGQVRVALGESARLGAYEVRIVPGALDAGGSGQLDARPAGAGEEAFPTVEGYKVTGALGAGGMGTVWRAVQLGADREVALKLMGTRRFTSPKVRARFEREVKLAARLEHPNIARVYDTGLHRGVYYYAMELVQGLHLDRYVQDGQLGPRQIVELMAAVCRAVQHAHDRGVVHRDLKPSNIIVSDDGQPHVLDFGLAKIFQEDQAEADMTISVEGEISGTPAYMSPEQAAGRHERTDARTDVYSLGVILYRLLTGFSPHDLSGTKLEVIHRILSGEIKPPGEVSDRVDRELEAIILKCLAMDPAARYDCAGQLAADLTGYVCGEPLIARPRTGLYALWKRIGRLRGRLAWAAVVLAVAGAGAAAILMPLSMRVDDNVTLNDVRQVQTTAETQWQRARLLDRGQGLGEKLDRGQTLAAAAQDLLNAHSYARARKAFEELGQWADLVTKLDADRRQALAARSVAERGRKLAADAQATTLAGPVWTSAVQAAQGAEAAFEAGQFDRARQGWTDANAQFAQARSRATEIPEVAAARQAYADALKALDEDKLRKFGGEAWAQVQAAVARAEGAGGDTTAAVDAYRQARALLPTARQTADAAEKSAGFQSHLTAADQLHKAGSNQEALDQVKLALTIVPSDAGALALRKAIEAEMGGGAMTLDLGRGAAMKLVLIPAGRFTMGSPAGEADRADDEGPQRVVAITRPFHMGATEVTRGQFAAFVQDSGYRTDAEKAGWAFASNDPNAAQVGGASWRKPGLQQDDTHPVVCVSWNDANAFCTWLARKAGRNVRLPTEAEWEYACRAGTTTPFHSGPTIDTSQANFDGNYTYGPGRKGVYRQATTPAASFAANAWGLYDMHGNAWEWCADWYGEKYYAAGQNTDPKGPTRGTLRAFRGGAWIGIPAYCRSAFRMKFAPDGGFYYVGFRVAMDN